MMIPVALAFPLINYLTEKIPSWGTWTLLLLALGLRGCLATNMFTAVMVFVNNSVPKSYMGRANGIGQTMAAAARSVGPTLAGTTWSLTSHAHFPFHSGVLFLVVISLFTLFFFLIGWYHPLIETPYEEIPKVSNRSESTNQLLEKVGSETNL